MAKETLDQLTAEEIGKFRTMLRHFKFPVSGDSEGPGDGGDVTLEPGLRGDAEGTVDGRIIAHNPGGVSRPFLTIREAEGELDVFLGAEGPGTATGDAKVGSLYIEHGSGRNGERPIKIHRRTVDGWVWSKWS